MPNNNQKPAPANGMSQRDPVAFYHSLLRFGVQPGLERIEALCAKLGNIQVKIPAVHIAGTNGKGSTATEIACILQAAGYKTGLYTSPYVIDFRERMQIDGEMISPQALREVTAPVEEAIGELNAAGVYPTEFEAITAAAFLWFYKESCDIMVLETGLGGRYDATNIIKKPAACVITSISFDHTAILGDTLAKIAWEKGGIIKRGVPVVTAASQAPEALQVIRSCCDLAGAPLLLPDENALFSAPEPSGAGQTVLWEGKRIFIAFPGAHQRQNAALALTAAQTLRAQGLRIPDAAIEAGLSAARIPARTELLCRDPVVLLDGSHNPGSIAALADVLPHLTGGRKVCAVMGMMADKDCANVLDLILPYFDRVIAVTPSNPRAMPAKEFAALIRNRNKPCAVMDPPQAAVAAALEEIDRETGALVVCGSLYLAADVRAVLLQLIKELF